jgi:hypothetical protein
MKGKIGEFFRWLGFLTHRRTLGFMLEYYSKKCQRTYMLRLSKCLEDIQYCIRKGRQSEIERHELCSLVVYSAQLAANLDGILESCLRVGVRRSDLMRFMARNQIPLSCLTISQATPKEN